MKMFVYFENRNITIDLVHGADESMGRILASFQRTGSGVLLVP
jgi:hypothetical protein